MQRDRTKSMRSFVYLTCTYAVDSHELLGFIYERGYRTYEYGPCVGMTRLERWDRAASLGLNPPEEVCAHPPKSRLNFDALSLVCRYGIFS
jgi:hypothetical protein